MPVTRGRIWSMLRLSSGKTVEDTPLNIRSNRADEEVIPSPQSSIPELQQVLILHEIKKPYETQLDYPVPSVEDEKEILVQTSVIGLNPIDWKAPDYNFGIPQLPYLSGRELSGTVAITTQASARIKTGDTVLVISTDYRDGRKAAYQQYAVANYFNVARVPATISSEAGASLGVAFVAAALSLGVCTGLDFSSIHGGPDILKLVRSIEPERLPDDIRKECMDGIDVKERLTSGDWLAVWGGSSTSAYMICQLARLAGVKTMSVLDLVKHGQRQHLDHSFTRADLLIDSHDPERAIQIARATADNNLRFAIDTVGRTTATSLLRCLRSSDPTPTTLTSTGTPPATPPSSKHSISAPQHTHLVGLTGLPKETAPADCVYHTVPIKLFHEIADVGEALMVWLEKLLARGLLKPPPLLAVEHGFDAVNPALDRMRKGEISGGRVVVRVD